MEILAKEPSVIKESDFCSGGVLEFLNFFEFILSQFKLFVSHIIMLREKNILTHFTAQPRAVTENKEIPLLKEEKII